MTAPSRYLVELAATAGGWQHLQQLTSRAGEGAEEMSREGAAVRFRSSCQSSLHADFRAGEREQ
jgi:hypothetical protein